MIDLKRNTRLWAVFLIIIGWGLSSCGDDDKDPGEPGTLQLTAAQVGSYVLSLTDASKNTAAPVSEPVLATFGVALDESTVDDAVVLAIKSSGEVVPVAYAYSNGGKTVALTPESALANNTIYQLKISDELRGTSGDVFPGHLVEFTTVGATITITSLKIGGTDVLAIPRVTEVPLTGTTIEVAFSQPVDGATVVSQNIFVTTPAGSTAPTSLVLSDDKRKVTITLTGELGDLRRYGVTLNSNVKGVAGEVLQNFTKSFYTARNETPDHSVITDDALLTLVQQQTFKYFWDFGHPVSGLARERNTSGDVVTSGGSGFGIMALIVGVERNFITRSEGVERMDKIVTFLEDADRFHGAWSHWINGSTGAVVPFSQKDDGGDLVETSFLVQGLLTFRQYLQASDTAGNNLINRITTLWQGVEWDWYRKNNEQVLYWHWSPAYDWQMNFAMYGYFEEQITYFLAAASPTHGIPKSVYSNGYGRNGAIRTATTHYGYLLPLGPPSPLFWVHYSYLGLDPKFSDDYADYWQQNLNATKINYAYCVANPNGYVGYSDECWGLTSSDDGQRGYDAHSPSNDNGTISPTAALSSFPYTPEESMRALKFFYYTVGDRLWGDYGFYDAFNLTQGWTADSYLAIDQGPIIVMIENYRTGLLWDLFMSAPEVQDGFTTLGFSN
ncbi:glucoamylase family protein [Parachryseolinea silvisoli]|uniref:glucoamylase family protein n=1 Tax=Parachryseolinea silvisoli TaxID=2873601 RepID=UPI0022657EDD|nr:glucoamylase family protein [Parachryseolinea silvisoli]MCD9014645.1 Ig-like domain-containing protein [Parachryseolinea silvisoli]